VTAHWASARPSARCSPTPASSAAGSTLGATACRTAEVGAPRREGGAGRDLRAEDKNHALTAAKAFADLYGTKWPKAVAKVTEHLDVLLASL